MASDPLSNFGDVDSTSGRSDYEWGSAQPIGDDDGDCERSPFIVIGAGFINGAGIGEIVALKRDSHLPENDNCYATIEHEDGRETRRRAKSLLQLHKSGRQTLLKPGELLRERAKRERAFERASREDDDHEGHVMIDGRVVDVESGREEEGA